MRSTIEQTSLSASEQDSRYSNRSSPAQDSAITPTSFKMKATILALFLSATGALAAPVAEPEAEAAGAQTYEHYGKYGFVDQTLKFSLLI
ncbi:hypothetical protein CB0940_04790 [Cercospora beticola]|uniref:Uncharacterized protein n=2 Tax=Cercospora beticola TaxID=122368 RepID=A0A2G5HL16_CERBT|nr:hypothetical protein CB0940_04790 [Cercospora beticola]PIA93247.1 hypothetical protein CB0940_04790 [Cercospora beticola]